MKSFKKLSRLVLNTQKTRDKGNKLTPTGGLVQDSQSMIRGMQDLRDMASRYQGLVTVSAQLAASAYEFSGAVQNLGSYCVKHFGSLENDDIGKIFETVGTVQFEISKSLDLYGSHVSQTIIVPTESLLSELHHLEDAKRQYDLKRQACNEARYTMTKGKIWNSKGEEYMERQVKQTKEDCEELAVFIGCRLLSLEHGRPRSLITQAARHYTAQVQLFGNVLEILKGVESYMKTVMQERNIDERLNSAPSVVSGIQNELLFNPLKQGDPARLQTNLKLAAATIVETPLSDSTTVCCTLGSYKDTGEPIMDVTDNEGIEKDIALWLQEGNILIAPMSPAKGPADESMDGKACVFGPPSRRPPLVPIPDEHDALVFKLPSSAGNLSDMGDIGDITSDSCEKALSILTVEGTSKRLPRGSMEGAADSVSLQPVHQTGQAVKRTTVGTTRMLPPTVAVAGAVISSGAAEGRTELRSGNRPLSAEAAAIRRYSQAGPEPAPSRRYSQSGPLSSSGTPWPAASKGNYGAATLQGPMAFPAPGRSPRVSKLQISELHRLPAPPPLTSIAATSSHAYGGRGFSTRSGPLLKSHEDIGPTKGRSYAQQQLLAAAAAQGRGAVSRSLSLPSSAHSIGKDTPNAYVEQSLQR